jgi:hypothetical protein
MNFLVKTMHKPAGSWYVHNDKFRARRIARRRLVHVWD